MSEPAVLPELSTAALAAELEARLRCEPDRGASRQVCPRCSTVADESLGEYSRDDRRFWCSQCGATLTERRYEIELEDYQAARWRARRDARELAEIARATR